MRILRFASRERILYGAVEGSQVVELDGDIFGEFELTGKTHAVEDVRILPPCEPSKIVALGLNYAEHIAEAGKETPTKPLIFLKAPSSIIGHGDTILLPRDVRKVAYEAELVAVVKNRIKNVEPEEALQHLLGYTCGNDVSARDFQQQDGQWARGKSCDTFCPLGPWIATGLVVDDVVVEFYQNGELRQSASTSLMLVKVPEIISFVSKAMTLLPGDIIMTGTPAGAGQLADGDVVEVRIEGIGSLINNVRLEESRESRAAY